MSKKIVLQTQSYHYTCGDGCCDDYGNNLFVNGEEVAGADTYMNPQEAIIHVLKHLGYDAEWGGDLEDDRFDARMGEWEDD